MKTTEQILIVHSVNGTSSEDLVEVQKAVKSFDRDGATVQVEPFIFEIPDGAAPGKALSSELYESLIRSIGAIVFVDDLRPNIAYELGFFHGQGRLVLLITKKNIEEIWLTISDLAGTPLAKIDKYPIRDYVINYLNKLYDELAFSDLWDSTAFPRENRNILNEITLNPNNIINTEFGKGIKITEWNKLDVNVGKNLLPNSKFTILLRTNKTGSLYTIYFKIEYSDTTSEKKEIWIGLSSVKRMANIQGNERLVPSKNATQDWTILQGTFEDLFKKSFILGKIKIESLNTLRFRAGSSVERDKSDIEIGYFNIIGLE